MIVSACFTNFGPYHLARLRALATALGDRGDRLVAIEVAGSERTYPWTRDRRDEPFEWVTLFPDRVLESLDARDCTRAIENALEEYEPDAIAATGYARPESMAAARWGRKRRLPVVLMSESQAIDRPRVWWKEAVKRRRVAFFDSALVGGPSHRDYLVRLGMRAERITPGYNAVDNAYFERESARYRNDSASRAGLPDRPYFLCVCRFVPEKNLERLVAAYALYRDSAPAGAAWDLVLCGGGLGEADLERLIARMPDPESIHRPGFLQVDALPRWYAFASAFVLPSVSEPWGLVANEAAACGLPLLISTRAGCAESLVPDPAGMTGARFDPFDVAELAARLGWLATLSESERQAMGERAAMTVARLGPERFAAGMLEAVSLAESVRSSKRTRESRFRVQQGGVR